MSDFEIRIARTEIDRAHAYRLRYELYVEQQGLFGDTADHERRWLRDDIDEHATIWLAEQGGEVVLRRRRVHRHHRGAGHGRGLAAAGAAGLSVEQLDAVLDGSHALDCHPGAALIRKGDTSRTIYVLLTGTLEVWDEGERIAVIDRPGEVVGEIAFFTGRERVSDVITGGGGARVLALSQRSLDGLIARQDPGVTKFLLTITRSLCQKMRGRAKAEPARAQRSIPSPATPAIPDLPRRPAGSTTPAMLEMATAA